MAVTNSWCDIGTGWGWLSTNPWCDIGLAGAVKIVIYSAGTGRALWLFAFEAGPVQEQVHLNQYQISRGLVLHSILILWSLFSLYILFLDAQECASRNLITYTLVWTPLVTQYSCLGAHSILLSRAPHPNDSSIYSRVRDVGRQTMRNYKLLIPQSHYLCSGKHEFMSSLFHGVFRSSWKQSGCGYVVTTELMPDSTGHSLRPTYFERRVRLGLRLGSYPARSLHPLLGQPFCKPIIYEERECERYVYGHMNKHRQRTM